MLHRATATNAKVGTFRFDPRWRGAQNLNGTNNIVVFFTTHPLCANSFKRQCALDKRHFALAVRNPELAPHLTFYDAGGHGYATVRCDADSMVTEFVCIPRPIVRAPGEDGGPLRYRVRHEVPLWKAGEQPRMTQTVVEGDTGLSV